MSADTLGRPLPVRALAVYGSPGLGRDVATVADLRLAPGTDVYGLAAPGDAVAWSGWHGENPVEPDTGVVRLDTGRGAGHSSYLDSGSVSLTSLALVAAGRGTAARRVPPAPDGGPVSAALADLCSRSDAASRYRDPHGDARTPGPGTGGALARGRAAVGPPT